MKERPILFSGPMVRAILDGRKTQTRRLTRIDDHILEEWETGPGKYQRGIPTDAKNVRMCGPYVKCDAPPRSATVSCRVLCPHGEFGDRLWVRETWARVPGCSDFVYRADLSEADEREERAVRRLMRGKKASPRTTPALEPWRPSIHMPREASRITLEVTSVRVERLQDITEDDAKAEGADPETHRGFANEQRIIGSNETKGTHPHKLAFAMLWDEINIERAPWIRNPFVWVVSFRRVKP